MNAYMHKRKSFDAPKLDLFKHVVSINFRCGHFCAASTDLPRHRSETTERMRAHTFFFSANYPIEHLNLEYIFSIKIQRGFISNISIELRFSILPIVIFTVYTY